MIRPTRAIPLLVMLAIAVTGCTATEADTAATPTPTPTPTTACLVGDWRVGADQLQPIYDALPGGLEYPAAIIDPAAAATIAFAADGTFDFAQDVPTSVTWLGRTASVVLGGSMSGTYATDGTALSLVAVDNALTVAPTDDGTASRIFAAETAETLAEWPVSASTFSCDGDTLVLDLDTEGYAASIPFVRG